MFDVADALGIGLYATEQYSESANETYPGNNDFNSYYRCMHDLENQELEIDMCIGELTFFRCEIHFLIIYCIIKYFCHSGQFWQTLSRTNVGIPTESFFQSNIKFISPMRESSTYFDNLRNVFRPFDFLLWITVLLCILFAGAVLSTIIHLDNHGSLSKENFFPHMFNAGFEAVNGFVTLSPSMRSSPSASEKVIVSGFIIFSLITVTAYTGKIIKISSQFDKFLFIFKILHPYFPPSFFDKLYGIGPFENRFRNICRCQ